MLKATRYVVASTRVNRQYMSENKEKAIYTFYEACADAGRSNKRETVSLIKETVMFNKELNKFNWNTLVATIIKEEKIRQEDIKKEPKTVYIVTWKTNTDLGFNFDKDKVYNTREEAKKTNLENYEIKEVKENFIPLYEYLNQKENIDEIEFFDYYASKEQKLQYHQEHISKIFFTYEKDKE